MRRISVALLALVALVVPATAGAADPAPPAALVLQAAPVHLVRTMAGLRVYSGFQVTCPVGPSPCMGTIEAVSGVTMLGRRDVMVRPGAAHVITVRVTPEGQQILDSSAPMDVAVTLRVNGTAYIRTARL